MSIFDAAQEQEQKKVRLKLRSVQDLEKFGRRCIRELYIGDLPAARAKALTALLDAQRRLMETASLAARLDALEAQLSGRGASGAEITEHERAQLRQRIQAQLRQRELQAAEEPVSGGGAPFEPEDEDTLDMFEDEDDPLKSAKERWGREDADTDTAPQ